MNGGPFRRDAFRVVGYAALVSEWARHCFQINNYGDVKTALRPFDVALAKSEPIKAMAKGPRSCRLGRASGFVAVAGSMPKDNLAARTRRLRHVSSFELVQR